MAQYFVDSAQVASASAATSAVAGRIRADVAQMMAQLNALQSSWGGAASSNFASVAEQWRGTQAAVEASLDNISQLLNVTANTYADAEQAAAGLFAG